ncbi:MAG TPA: bifunctional 3-(3-hydroxy-phenyl)propionate/3-hydroxycinnamic acid hydroxylase [Steroidobacteraceae bacterium]|nr:bifunctional 3-(3-hydroxy-phenyl)propionate/3-hydroxycinnamic acid hydroxylase [Steroidobacteraceae bacterium]
MDSRIYDVIQVGYGPVSQALALMLGRQGRSIAVCERWKTRYPLPRAVCIDHELYRVLSANGMGTVLPSISHPGPRYQWFNAEWEELLAIDWSAESISGGTEVNFVHQPTLEHALDQAVARLSNVDQFLGWEVTVVRHDARMCHVTLRADTGVTRELRARYVVGCDGANSIVRSAIGSGQEDRGFEADWLVIDVMLKDGVTIEKLGIPPAGQYCNPVRPTTIVPAGVSGRKLFRRWEFMRLPGEQVADMEREDRVWELLEPWAGPADVELVRHKVYNFRSLLATRWRDGRVLLAGDAAHVMPPFMGQGMCSGMRDAWNLAWKLALILDGKADERLLDTYQLERLPHVSQLIDLSIYLGKVICIPDPAEAATRDQAFKSGTALPPPPFPHLTGGLIHCDADGSPSPGAGLLSPHVSVQQADRKGRFDDIAGLGFAVISKSSGPASLMSATALARSRDLQMRLVTLGDEHSPLYLRDLDGRLVSFMAQQDWAVMIVRPDFYVYGGAQRESDLENLLTDLFTDLSAAGLA